MFGRLQLFQESCWLCFIWPTYMPWCLGDRWDAWSYYFYILLGFHSLEWEGVCHTLPNLLLWRPQAASDVTSKTIKCLQVVYRGNRPLLFLMLHRFSNPVNNVFFLNPRHDDLQLYHDFSVCFSVGFLFIFCLCRSEFFLLTLIQIVSCKKHLLNQPNAPNQWNSV